MSNLEQLVGQLRKAVAQAAESGAAQVVQFKGQAVLPGHARSARGDLHILQDAGDRWLAQPHDSDELVALPKALEGSHYQIVQPLRTISDRIIDSQKHGHPFNTSDLQRQLIHGADVVTWHTRAPGHVQHKPIGDGSHDVRDEVVHWVRAQGKPAIIKSDALIHRRGRVENEATFHNVMRDALGLGQYVPTTALFHHPATGELHSIQRGVPRAQHFNPEKPNPRHMEILGRLAESGDLDKLALADGMMGASDRHYLNTVFSPSGMFLIDNSRLFSSRRHQRPHYWDTYYSRGYDGGLEGRLHAGAVQWANDLKPEVFENALRAHNLPAHIVDEHVRRLHAVKGLLRGTDGAPRRSQAYEATMGS